MLNINYISKTFFNCCNIPIKAIVNGVIITKDNRYVKVLEFNASKFTSMTRSQRYALTEGFQRVLNILPDRFQMTAMTFPSDISAAF